MSKGVARRQAAARTAQAASGTDYGTDAGPFGGRRRDNLSDVPTIGPDDQFESEYMAKLRALLTTRGLPLSYEKDRAALDAGLHLFVEGRASQARVWFQVKGKRATTLSLEHFRNSVSVAVRVAVDHLRFWYAAPEPVYLAVYIEAADVFIAEDVRDVVDRGWPDGNFYAAVPATQGEVTVHVDAQRPLNADRLDSMLSHRSMRVDGPAWRGRPLGHRFDPIRSQLDVCEPELFRELVGRILAAHDFRTSTEIQASAELALVEGRLYQTLEWQSPAFAEFGYRPNDDFRDEPAVESVHDRVLIAVDSRPNRTHLDDVEREAFSAAGASTSGDATLILVFNGRDLSGSGGLWRSTWRDTFAMREAAKVHHVGLEALTSILLVTTLVFLDVAPKVKWRYVNFVR